MVVRELVFSKGRLGRGICLRSNVSVAGVNLLKGDSLEPSMALQDVMDLETARIPLAVRFWRPRFDRARRCIDRVTRRNPIFAGELGTNPQDIVQVDLLHTLNFGLMERVTSASLWRVLLSNPWKLPGPEDQIRSVGLRRLRAHMIQYFSDSATPHDRRIGDLTEKMLGDRSNCTSGVGGVGPHPGRPLHAKAADMHVLMRWSIVLLESSWGRDVAHRVELVASMRAIERFIDVTKTAGMVPTVAQAQSLRDEAQRAILGAGRGGVSFTIKSHMLAECSIRVAQHVGTIGCMRPGSMNH